MKNLCSLFLIILTFMFSVTAYAQHTTRPIGRCGTWNNGTSWIIQDSLTFIYAAGNNSTGVREQYIEQMLMCDSIYTHKPLSPGMWSTTNLRINYINSNGVKDSVVYMVKNSSGIWVRYNKYNYRYNANNDITEFILQNYDSTAKVYHNGQRTAYSYAGRNMTELLAQYFTSGSWVNFNRYRHTYTGANLTMVESEDYNTLTTMWDPASKQRLVYSAGRTGNDIDSLIVEDYAKPPMNSRGYLRCQVYDANGNPATTNTFTWNYVAGRWDILGRSLKTFNSNKQTIIDTASTWNAANSSFEPNGIELYQYNNYGVLDSQTTIRWDSATAGFRNTYLTIRRYNVDTFHTMVQYYQWSVADNEWSTNGSTIIRYYYETVPTGIKDASRKKALFSLYPNPANDILNISMNSIQGKSLMVRMYNTTGALVHQRELAGNASNNYSIPVYYLQPGIYTLAVSSGTESGAAQFVISR